MRHKQIIQADGRCQVVAVAADVDPGQHHLAVTQPSQLVDLDNTCAMGRLRLLPRAWGTMQ
jgi:hypothetical protein